MEHRPQPNNEIDHVLRHIKQSFRVRTYKGQYFVPRYTLQKYLTRKMIKTLLEITCADSLKVEPVTNKYLAVYVILLSINKGAYINHFLQRNQLSDAFLPFNDNGSWPAHCLDFFEDFDRVQWEFCAQELSSDSLDDKVFDSRLVVPIISQKHLKGGDSRTWKVEIHPDYNCLSPASRTSLPQPEYFILKTCRAGKVDLHLNKVRAYTALRHHEQISDNIACFYGSWRQGDSYSILLEYVEGGTLEDLFRRDHPASAWDMLHFWKSLLQLLDPVCRIHCQGDPATYNEVAHRVHQDIKPENILVGPGHLTSDIRTYQLLTNHRVYQDIKPENMLVGPGHLTSDYGLTFKLADLGLAYIPSEVSQRQANRGGDVPGTQMYSAPECYRDENDMSGQRSPRLVDCKKDIWSLGCVFSEAVVWSVLGKRGLNEYRQSRKVETAKLPGLNRTGYTGCFHDGEKVLTAVRDMHDKVRNTIMRDDNITWPVLFIIECMLSVLSERQSATDVRKNFLRAWGDAHRLRSPTADTERIGASLSSAWSSSSTLGNALMDLDRQPCW